MSASVDHLNERVQDSSELLNDIMPSAITLAMMLRHRNMAAWMRAEFEGYQSRDAAPPYRRDLHGHIVARSPQYGWIPAPVNEQQKQEYAHLDLIEGIRELEEVCVNSKKGDGQRVLLAQTEMLQLQRQINLSAELAINLSREVYCQLLRTVRATLYLWTQEVMARGLQGEHNHYSPEERNSIGDLDTPDRFWRRAMAELEELPIPEVRTAGFLERMFGRAG